MFRRKTAIVKIRQPTPRQRHTQYLLNRADCRFIFGYSQRKRFARMLGAPGTARSVNVRIHRIRHIKVDDMRNLGHVDAACSNVGGDQDVEFAITETVDGAQPRILRHVTLQRSHTIALVVQVEGQIRARVAWCG